MRWMASLLALTGIVSAGGISFTGYVGGSSVRNDMDPSPSWSIHALYRLDQMVSAGLGAGYVSIPGTDVAEVSSRLQVRLPIGSQLMPFLEGESGVGLRPVLEESMFLWRVGAGGDLKLGDKSSLLLGGGLQATGRMYGRVGLLLEL